MSRLQVLRLLVLKLFKVLFSDPNLTKIGQNRPTRTLLNTLSLLGGNTVFSTVREMPIVGGSGAFRFARGYGLAKTQTFDVKTGDAAVEYYVYVFYY
ncbi:hypothetical protein glysoja_028412 [Glycine soja]|uniref:Dirigent protein n=1 Tax=Glycine soja TaxID=3848 RepID=A0A0B2SK42_GLYSO|nr:hypothetical protein glysoja_028412 [Glycine soja]